MKGRLIKGILLVLVLSSINAWAQKKVVIFRLEARVSKRFISMIEKENHAFMIEAKKNGMKLFFDIVYHEMDMLFYGIEFYTQPFS